MKVHRHTRSTKENISIGQYPILSGSALDNATRITVSHSDSKLASISSFTMPPPPPMVSHAGSFSGYLARPLETLRLSLADPAAERITLHDLAETYNVTSARLKAVILIGLDSEQGAMALQSIQASSSIITKILLRDVSRLLIHPFSSADDSRMEVDSAQEEEEMQHALDLTSLGHQAIRLLSEIAAFPAIHALFSDQQLGSFLGAVFDILTAPTLPTPHFNRTYALLLWLLQVQQLPLDILRRFREETFQVLRRAIGGSYPKEATRLDGLKIVEHFLRTWPGEFWEPCQEFLPTVLEFLTSSSLDLRFQAAHTISAFASAKLELLRIEENGFLPISAIVQSFTEKDPRDESSFLYILGRACKRKKIKHQAKGPQWAAVTISSLLLLLDSYIFWCPHTLRGFLDGLLLIRHRQHDEPDDAFAHLHPLGWKSLIWAFSRLPSRLGRMSETAQEEDDMQQRAFRVTKQELRDGMGVLMVSKLLGDLGEEDGAQVVNALDVVKDMVSKEEAVMRQGISLLRRLVVHSENRDGSMVVDVSRKFQLDQQLFDGSVLGCKREKLAVLLESMNQVDLGIVRELSDDEITRYFGELVEVWKRCLHSVLESRTRDFDSDLFNIWQSLLLARSQLDANKAQLTVSTELARVVKDVHNAILDFEISPEAEPHRLYILRKVWQTTTQGFASESLQGPAKAILSGLVTQGFDLCDECVRPMWSTVCAEISQTLNPVVNNDESAFEMHGWTTMVPIWIKTRVVSPKNLMVFAKIPFPGRLQCEDHFLLWSRLCRKALDVAHSAAADQPRDWHVDVFLSHLTDGNVDKLCALPRHTHALVAAIHTPGIMLSDRVLNLLNDTLTSSYTQPSDVRISLRMVDLTRDILNALSSKFVVSFISSLEKGLCYWLRDEKKVITDDEYNDTIVPLYQVALDKLVPEEPSNDTVNKLENFFTAPFIRSPPPGTSYILFKDFWLEKYWDRRDLIDGYSQYFKGYLRGLDEYFPGQGIAVHFSQTDSQEPQSIVPETFQSQFEHQRWSSQAHGGFDVAEEERAAVGLSSPKINIPSNQHFSRAHSHISADKEAATSDSGSSHKRKRIIMDYVEISSQGGSSGSCASRKARNLVQEGQLMTPEPSRYIMSSPHPAEEDYASWEKAISPNQLEELEQGPADQLSASNLILHSPSYRPHKRQKVRQRLFPAGDDNARLVSPGVSSSDRLHQLQLVYNAFSNDQDISVEELAQADKMLQRLVTVVNERLTGGPH
ncbi:hypothetical protein K435DRAFT_962215 [Dendrothele bispora CBS 962.96]|uniref:Telomere-associated protein Rif1 N-terminal domain-containing protein n=1 Tax=Dendrothele bispora (strain CBS 962.96) TaxID=1314807 RepID=A0A4S8MLY3_DENBC|nr:hypothetical protein K435DRAFT_962215 [Dendrothele bispora CBS 962.96]